ncbi:hypothetical protein ABW19_dt0202871 [Dactylella cylindrospora]|nr:hypothetical protein ABW19_dt0202871 [Dactylella cylindrospora]
MSESCDFVLWNAGFSKISFSTGGGIISDIGAKVLFTKGITASSSSADLRGTTESTTRMLRPLPLLVFGMATAVIEVVAIVAPVFKGPLTIGFPANAVCRSFLRCSRYFALKSGSTNQSSLLFADPSSLSLCELPRDRALATLLEV